MQIFRNDHAVHDGSAPRDGRGPAGSRNPRRFHRSIEGYESSRLVEVAGISRRVGIGRVLVKHEQARFGLPSFKIIGASWASYCALCARCGHDPAQQLGIAELRAELARLGLGGDGVGHGGDGGRLTLVTATDGNHGRAVARAASWFGLAAHIYVPHDTVSARIDAIRSEGATLTVVDGDYDEAVHIAAASAGEDRLVISDTSWPGYTEVPTWISEGYTTIFEEIDEQLAEHRWGTPDAFVMPVGVGAFALASLDHWPSGAPVGPVRIAVEPTAADCLYRSLVAGEPVTVPGPHESMMAGMNCGTLSMVAWPTMRDRFDWCVTIEDEAAAEAMRLLAAEGLVVGETGAASVGMLLALAEHSPDTLAEMGLGPDSTVVCLATEGATDPRNYEAVVGVAPSAVTTR